MPVAMVTGAGRGIGAACARALAAEGFDVGLTYASDREAAERVAGELRAAGRAALVTPLEARAPEDPERAVAAVEDGLGAIQALVLNAGTTRDGPALRMDAEQWRDVLEVNLSGAFRAARAAIAGMERRRRGAIVAISSVVGVRGNVGQVNYAASKAALLGLVRTLARELGPAGVRVNAVTPGFVRSRLTEVLTPERRQRILAATALGRLGEPEDVAGPVAFLCSPRASFITGAVLAIDGGLAL